MEVAKYEVINFWMSLENLLGMIDHSFIFSAGGWIVILGFQNSTFA
jgi:hypothetical protein